MARVGALPDGAHETLRRLLPWTNVLSPTTSFFTQNPRDLNLLSGQDAGAGTLLDGTQRIAEDVRLRLLSLCCLAVVLEEENDLNASPEPSFENVS